MKSSLQVFAILMLVAGLIFLAGWWQVYRWQDCRRVGHAWFYCLMTAGK